MYIDGYWIRARRNIQKISTICMHIELLKFILDGAKNQFWFNKDWLEFSSITVGVNKKYTWWAISCDMTLATFCLAFSIPEIGSQMRVASRNISKPQFSIAPAAKCGTANISEKGEMKWGVNASHKFVHIHWWDSKY